MSSFYRDPNNEIMKYIYIYITIEIVLVLYSNFTEVSFKLALRVRLQFQRNVFQTCPNDSQNKAGKYIYIFFSRRVSSVILLCFSFNTNRRLKTENNFLHLQPLYSFYCKPNHGSRPCP